VTDQSGAAVPQTAVSIRKIGTGLVSNTVTNAEGAVPRGCVPDGNCGYHGVRRSYEIDFFSRFDGNAGQRGPVCAGP
jgi:hypothetical protein